MKDFPIIKEWWTPAEIAAAGLPDMPSTRQGVDAMLKAGGWRDTPDKSRQRQGRGGGREYHWQLFPTAAQRHLMASGDCVPAKPTWKERAEAWAYFDSLPQAAKAEAQRKLGILTEIERLSQVTTKQLAIEMVAPSTGKTPRTIWNWFAMVDGVEQGDWLPYLAPRHRDAAKSGAKAEADPLFFDWLKADFLREGGGSFAASHRRVMRLCQANGISGLNVAKTAQRQLDLLVPKVTQTFMREGEAGLLKRYPPQIRDRSTLGALEGVNADCHKIDVFVRWPGFDKPIRPQIVAFQDLYSGKILSWRVDVDPNKVAVMSAMRELLGTWGIPRHCLFDNGREFANKWLTGGAKTRFRFKVRKDEPLGVLELLGIQIHWATPGHGQAKPIERGFRDFADDIARDPRFHGAYTGHKPDAKPSNYGETAIELDVFLEVLAEGVAEHNARQGRLSQTARGRSFDDAFAESYAKRPITKATDEQLRLCLMAQKVGKLHATHGRMTIAKNGYWSEWMNEFAGQEVIARFNPEDLHAGAYIYSPKGEFLGFAACQEKSEFFDLASAKAAARDRARRTREQRRLAKELRPVSVGGLAAELDKLPKRAEARPEAKVVKLAQQTEIARLEQRQRGKLIQRPKLAPTTSPEQEAQLLQFEQAFTSPKARPGKSCVSEQPRDRFLRAMELQERSERGERIGEAEAQWFERYSSTPEFQSQRTMYERFGEQGLA
ncbi:transposase domain-containing protein [Maritimibacter alkaliphilus]|uniref:transposase domain-containing protein n=1 Tax=Maritimibacter alkaliphilus TaxID=404236 RepID=UPI001C93BAE3|nr:transposase domain-containing protein [Maritimibacter alkaliphilus]MBY6091046.1 Mu transposase C-terminal domain-containing protein [Maritimibacter alkaliphilus]